MLTTVLRSEEGFSLVEVMIALLITLVVFLAMMQAVLLSIDANAKNALRNEATSIAESRISAARNTSFDQVLTDVAPVSGCPDEFTFGTGQKMTRTIRNASVDFCTNMTVTPTPDGNNKRVEITVGWDWRGEYTSLDIMTIRRK
ncbi:MAG: type IV pilus modification PilV family protein [Thermodesulfovibrionales bacterium]